MPANQLVFQQGSEVIVDVESDAAAGAWTIGVLNLVRTGPLVVMHLEATGGTGTITTLQADFAPGVAVTDGAVTVSTAGVVAAASSPARTTLAWIAGQASP
jgi:hypothetical protein